MNCHVFVDFDGTIMPCDTTDFLLDRFALPSWHEIEAEWTAGRIGSRDCLARQVDLLRATPAAIADAIGELEIDPAFAGFLDTCSAHGVDTTIVSDGFDLVIAAVLARYGLAVPFFANRLVSCGGDRWKLEFPHMRNDCASAAGHCKCARTAAHPNDLSVVVGDGRSDFCIAARADFVLAKSKLLEECRNNGTPHLPFCDFSEAAGHLQSWIERHAARRAGVSSRSAVTTEAGV